MHPVFFFVWAFGFWFAAKYVPEGISNWILVAIWVFGMFVFFIAALVWYDENKDEGDEEEKDETGKSVLLNS